MSRRSRTTPLSSMIATGLGGRGATMITNMLVLAITSRLLTPAQFGAFAICQIIIDLGQAASIAFISVPVLQQARMRSAAFYRALTLTAIVALTASALLALSGQILADWLRMPVLKPLLYAIVPVLALRILASFYIGVLQRRMRILEVVRAQYFSQITSALVVTLPLAWAGLGAWSLVGGIAAATLVELTMLMAHARVPLRFTLAGNFRSMVAMGWPTLVNRMLMFAGDSADRIVVGRAFGAFVLGIYARSANLVLLPINLVGLPLQSAMMAWFSRNQAKLHVVHDTIRTTVAIQSFLLPVALLGLWFATPMIVLIMLGNQWHAAIPIAQILFVGSLARLGTIPLESACMVLKYSWSSASRQAIALAVLAVGLTLAALQTPIWAAYAVSLSRLTYYLLCVQFSMRTFALPLRTVAIESLRGLTVAAIAFTPTFIVAQYHPLPGLIGATVLFAIFATTALVATIALPAWISGPVKPLLRQLNTQLFNRKTTA